MWIFKPFSDLKIFSHWSHLKAFSSATFSTVSFTEACSLWVESKVVDSSFFFKNSALLLAFLLKADGVFLFFFALEAKATSPLVAKEKEKLSPMVKAKEKVSDLLDSDWQKSRHWDKSAALSSLEAFIFTDYF